jgi:hypothetical protein
MTRAGPDARAERSGPGSRSGLGLAQGTLGVLDQALKQPGRPGLGHGASQQLDRALAIARGRLGFSERDQRAGGQPRVS